MRSLISLALLFPMAAQAGWVEAEPSPYGGRRSNQTLEDSFVVGTGEFDRRSPGNGIAIAVQWSSATVLHTLSYGGRFLELSEIEGDFPYPASTKVDVGDFNSDGLDDLSVGNRFGQDTLVRSHGRFVEAYWSTPDVRDCADFAFREREGRARPDFTCVGIGDVDGDGRQDRILQRDRDGTREWTVRGSGGSAWTTTRSPGVEVIGVADANGDGLDDLWLQFDHQGKRYWQVRLSDGDAFSIKSMPQTTTKTRNVQVVGIEDADGDGRADLWLQYDHRGSRRWQVRRSTGSSFRYNGDWTSTRSAGVEVLAITDANGDGKADLWVTWDTPDNSIAVGGVKRRFQLRPSTGTSFGSAIGGAEVLIGREARLVQRDRYSGVTRMERE